MKLKTLLPKPIKNEPDYNALTLAILPAGRTIEAEKINSSWYSIGEGHYISNNNVQPVATIKPRKAE